MIILQPSISVAFFSHPHSWKSNQDERCERFKVHLYEAIVDAYHDGYRIFYSGLSADDFLYTEMLVTMRNDPIYAQLQIYAILEPINGKDGTEQKRLLDLCTDSIQYEIDSKPSREQFMRLNSTRILMAWDSTKGAIHNLIGLYWQSVIPIDNKLVKKVQQTCPKTLN